MTLFRRIFALALSIVCFAGLSSAKSDQVSLKGITQLRVDISFNDGAGAGSCADKVLAKKYGLLKDDVRTDIELQLRQSGLKVGPGQLLHLDVTGCSRAVTIILELREWATVAGRGTRGVVSTWGTAAVLFDPDNVRTRIRDLVAEFVNQWLADK